MSVADTRGMPAKLGQFEDAQLQRQQLEHLVLSRLDGFRQELEYARSQGDIRAIKHISDGIQALKYVAQKAKLDKEVQNEAAENHLDTQRAGGEVLAKTEFDRGGRPSKNHFQRGSGLRLEDIPMSDQMSHRWQRLAKIPEDKYRAKIAEIRTEGWELTSAAMLEYAQSLHNHRAQGTGENEWYTPPDVLEDVRRVLGTIELDPASSDTAQEFVQAERYFTKEQDSLTWDWFGKVFLNPPYSQPEIEYFAAKMAAEVKAGRVSESIMLTYNYTDTRWFRAAKEQATLICFTTGRIVFIPKHGTLPEPTQGQAFFYYGENPGRFAGVFRERGFILQPYNV